MEPDTKKVEEAQPAAAPAPAKDQQQANKKAKGEKTKHGEGSHRGRSNKKGMVELEPVIGTRDFYPEDMRVRNWLFGSFREVARQFCFQEYDAPILELDELYKRKAGEDITKQMYNFKDKEDYEVTLRPEMTPSLARMILKKGKSLLLPVKWFSIPQCWRFETVQIGRKREHYQWNMDIIGVASVTAEVELLAAIVALFKKVGLTEKDVGLKVNSRKVLQAVLEPLGVTAEKFAPVCVVVDKLDKLSPEQVQTELVALGLEANVIEAIQNTLGLKSLDELAKVLTEESPVTKELREFWKIAEGYGIADWLVFDASVVRGLAYYTGIVFEGFDRPKKFRAICGGGRYDKLMNIYGSKEVIPAAGFGFGDCVIKELLEDLKKLPSSAPEIDFLVTPFDESMRATACGIANQLRALPGSPRVDVQLMPNRKPAWVFGYADRVGANKIVFVAPDEVSEGMVRVKDLRAAKDSKDDKGFNVKMDELHTLL